MTVRPAPIRHLATIDPSLVKRCLVGGGIALFAVFIALQFVRTKATGPLDYLPTFFLALAPLWLYLAVRWPLIFPFCAYVLMLPFESLSLIGSAGTLAKFIGIACAIAMLVEVLVRKNWVPVTRALAAWMLLFSWMSISAFWAIDQADVWLPLQTFASLLLLYAVISIKRATRLEFSAVLAAIVVAGIVSAGYAAFVYHGGGHNVIKSASRVMLVVGDSQIDPNSWAASLVLPIAVVLYWLFNARTLLVRITMLPCLGILFAGLAACGSRGGILSVLTIFALLCIRSRHRLRLLATVVVSATLAVVANPGLVARFQAAQTDDAAGRTDVWKIGLRAFRDHWLIGAGEGNFSNAYDDVYLRVSTHHLVPWHFSSHSVPLQIATELGIVGLALWIAMLYFQMGVLRVIDKSSELYELRLALEGAFLGGIVSSLSGANFSAKYIWLTYFAMVILRSYAIASQKKSLAEQSRGRGPFAGRPTNANLVRVART